MFRSKVVACFILLFGASVPAMASFVEPSSWTRADGGATYQAWDAFNALSDATPDVASVNGNGTALLTETTGHAFLTSGGNMYSFSGATSFTVTIPEADVPFPAHDVTAIVQIKTLGSALDLASVTLNGQAAVDYAELDQSALGGFGGSAVSHWFLFNVDYADFGDGIAGTETLTLVFDSASSSMSLDQLSIDTAVRPYGFYAEPNPTPEPSSLAILGLGAAAMLRRRRLA